MPFKAFFTSIPVYMTAASENAGDIHAEISTLRAVRYSICRSCVDVHPLTMIPLQECRKSEDHGQDHVSDILRTYSSFSFTWRYHGTDQFQKLHSLLTRLIFMNKLAHYLVDIRNLLG